MIPAYCLYVGESSETFHLIVRSGLSYLSVFVLNDMTDLVVFAERLNLFQTNRPWPVSSTTRSWNEALGGDVNWFDRFAAQHAVRGPGVSGPTRWWRLDKPKDDPLNIATSNKGSGIAISS